jgi:hypothetical protein
MGLYYSNLHYFNRRVCRHTPLCMVLCPAATTKGQTHREAGAQSYGPLETEAAGPPKGDSCHLDILM